MNSDDWLFQPQLQCGLHSVTVESTQVAFHLPERHCVDGEGAITLATAINPDVTFIATVSGEVLDTCYGKVDDRWRVVDGEPLLQRNPFLKRRKVT